jgi:aldose sugar dehydrogenase
MRTRGRSIVTQLAWHGLVLVILACLPVLKFKAPWWQLPRREWLPLVVLLAAYGASASITMALLRNDSWRTAGHALAVTLGVFCGCLMLLLLFELHTPRYLLLAVFLAAAALVPLSVSGQPSHFTGIAILSVALATVGALSARAIASSQHTTATATPALMKTAFYPLQLVAHEGLVPRPATRGGGLDRLGNRVLLGTGDGYLYVLAQGAGGDIGVQQLPTRVPANREEFAAAFNGSSIQPTRSAEFSEAGPARMQTWRFRVADILTQMRGERVRIFASHHFWKAAEKCFVVRVSAIETSAAHITDTIDQDGWRTMYESSPCIPLEGQNRKRGKNAFRGEEIGGRMALLDEHTLLVTVGDHGFNGAEALQMYSQDSAASYGKTIRIDLDTLEHETYTLGHRNPQGLFAAQGGRVWLSEHGSQGGDELNLLSEHANYGWPLVSYGTDYGVYALATSSQQGRHAGYTQPAYAWVPSIGVSSLIALEGDAFPIWKGDLIVGSLATRSLYRLALEGDRVVLAEPISVGWRVRDLLECNDGSLLLWTDDAALVTIEPARGSSAELQYAQLCSGCHQIKDGASHRIGPDLYGILGRKLASAGGYDEYSPSLRQIRGTWSKERLDAFLRDPQKFAPGTTMGFAGIPDEQQRAALVDYLAASSGE